MSAEVQTAPKAVSLMDRQVAQRRNERAQQQNRRPNAPGNNKDQPQQQQPHQQHNNKNKKHENDGRYFKSGRKRSQSFGAGSGKFFPPYKRRKKDAMIPPTKFLLGGNICDPLNLNSLQDEEINRAMNAVTPKSSPLPTPKHRKGAVEVIIPPNINDPLNLADCDDDYEYEQMLISPIKRSKMKKKNKYKRKHLRSNSGPGSGKEDSGVEETGLCIEDRRTSEAEPAMPGSDNTETMEVARLTRKEPNLRLDLDLALPPASAGQQHPQPSTNVSADRDVKRDDSSADAVSGSGAVVSNKEGSAGGTGVGGGGGGSGVPSAAKKPRKELKDKIVSPVIPQPGAWVDFKAHRYRLQQIRMTPQINKNQATPKFNENNTRFRYGNYNRYYGYRNANQDCDVRLKVFARKKDLFEGKDVLDIGCNVGHVTLAVARDLRPAKVVGIDIDKSLIEAARKNIRHYLDSKLQHYPASMPIVYGPLHVPTDEKVFPDNISFIQGNYVLESDVLLDMEKPQFDTILCLSITKWLQLNWGDAGLKRAFKRMYAQLRPDGVLILEAQPWHSYTRKRNLTSELWHNYTNIELFPHKFSQFLLSEVGFTKCEVIGAPHHFAKGFQRPIKLFLKGSSSSTMQSATEVNANKSSGKNAMRGRKARHSEPLLETIKEEPSEDVVTGSSESETAKMETEPCLDAAIKEEPSEAVAVGSSESETAEMETEPCLDAAVKLEPSQYVTVEPPQDVDVSSSESETAEMETEPCLNAAVKLEPSQDVTVGSSETEPHVEAAISGEPSEDVAYGSSESETEPRLDAAVKEEPSQDVAAGSSEYVTACRRAEAEPHVGAAISGEPLDDVAVGSSESETAEMETEPCLDAAVKEKPSQDVAVGSSETACRKAETEPHLDATINEEPPEDVAVRTSEPVTVCRRIETEPDLGTIKEEPSGDAAVGSSESVTASHAMKTEPPLETVKEARSDNVTTTNSQVTCGGIDGAADSTNVNRVDE